MCVGLFKISISLENNECRQEENNAKYTVLHVDTVYLLLSAQIALIMNSVPFKHNFLSMQIQKISPGHLTLQNLHKTNQKPSGCS